MLEINLPDKEQIADVMERTIDNGRISALIQQNDPNDTLGLTDARSISRIKMAIGSSEELVPQICRIMLADRHTSLDDVLGTLRK